MGASGLLERDAPGYATACASWNARVEHHPDAVALPASPEEVAAAVRYAAAHDMPVRVQMTGHGATEAVSGGMLISTVALTGVSIDPGAGSAEIHAGAKWKDVVEAAYGVGFAAPCGTSSDVGSLGFTLGGGTNWFARKYGLASDMMTAAQIVTADGRLRWVDAEHEPDLFWALRGGGPNFGVVTAIRIKLLPHPRVYAGHLMWPVDRFADVVTAWRDWVRTAPVEITSTAAVLHTPNEPSVPEPMRGRSFVAVMACYAGDPDAGAGVVAPLRDVPGRVLDEIATMPFLQIDNVSQDPVDPLPHSIWCTMLRDLDDATIAKMAAIAPRGTLPYLLMEIRHVGGGVRPPADRLGLAHWSGDFLVDTVSFTPDRHAFAAATAMADRLDAEFADVSTGMTPLNFVSGQQRVARAFTPAHLDRLRRIKDVYDPDRLFGGDRSISTAMTAT